MSRLSNRRQRLRGTKIREDLRRPASTRDRGGLSDPPRARHAAGRDGSATEGSVFVGDTMMGRMTRTGIVLCLLISASGFGRVAQAQEVTANGFTPEAELITLGADTQLDQALRIMSAFAGRLIVDSRHLTVPIGIDISREPWPRALERIAAQHGLAVSDQVSHLELVLGGVISGGSVESGATVDSREVSIKAIFFQADRSALRELGVDWGTLSGGRVDVRASQLGASRVTSDQFSVGFAANISRSLSIEALLKTFESENAGEVVARPQIKVRSGKVGRIQVGTDFSITTADFAGNAITQFFSTGTILTVKPVVHTEDDIDFIELEVEAERSSVVDPVRNLISKTVAKTSVLLRDGEQTAIGGLYGEVVSVSRNGVPFLKDLPAWMFGLRYLFGHESTQYSKTELVVMLKVDLVPSVRERVERLSRETGKAK